MLIILIIIINLITGLLVKKQGVLSCGLTAFCGSKPADPSKVKIIALFNESRGKDSCGIFSNGKVTKGWLGNKPLISDLLTEEDIVINNNWRNIIIHTRKSTQGSHVSNNCHPFEYSKGNQKMWFAHNGMIRNCTELCAEVGLDYKDFDVDSNAIGAIIFQEKNCKVFQKYKGAGAFIFCNNSEKNTLYVYKGGAGDKEERPLFYWSAPEGMYISSLLQPLQIISPKTDLLYEFALNTLYKITDGKIVEKIPLSRVETLHDDYREPYNYHHSNYTPTDPFQNLGETAYKYLRKNYRKGTRVYWREGRFFRDGHLLHGTVMLSNKLGYYKTKKKILMKDEFYQEYYFYHGIMLRDFDAFETLSKTTSSTARTAWDISKFAAFPFCTTDAHNFPMGYSNADYKKHCVIYNVWYGLNLTPIHTVPFEADDQHVLSFKSDSTYQQANFPANEQTTGKLDNILKRAEGSNLPPKLQIPLALPLPSLSNSGSEEEIMTEFFPEFVGADTPPFHEDIDIIFPPESDDDIQREEEALILMEDFKMFIEDCTKTSEIFVMDYIKNNINNTILDELIAKFYAFCKNLSKSSEMVKFLVELKGKYGTNKKTTTTQKSSDSFGQRSAEG